MKEKRLTEIKGIVLVAIGLMVLVSLVRFDGLDLSFYTSHPNLPTKNLLGIFGAYLGAIFVFLFGRFPSFLIPLLVLFVGIKFFRQELPYLSLPRILGFLILLLSLASLIGMFNFRSPHLKFYYAGILGSVISRFISAYFGRLGGFIIFITLVILSFALVTETLLSSFFFSIINKTRALLRPFFAFKRKIELLEAKSGLNQKKESREQLGKPKMVESVFKSSLVLKPRMQIKTAKSDKVFASTIKSGDIKTSDTDSLTPGKNSTKIEHSLDYVLPALDLLDSPPPFEARQIKEDLNANARILEDTLEDFGILVRVTDIERGPIITRYELEPAPGVKLNRIVALSDDIALTMKAQSVRIVAPIPGKARVGVEVPNIQSSFVYLKEALSSPEFKKSTSKLTLVLGKDITGQPVIADLNDMPHLLIAGTTGSGKTVCVNCLILSLLFRATPHELKFLMIDPKMVELAPFNGLTHLLCPVVTDAKKASLGLNWLVNEMENRYQLLAKIGARNIEVYNEGHERIPYIVVIIDELADLMSVAKDKIENAITRLAQLSRAVGIHLILATQRPSVDVITGVIKANFSARISFKVASKVDSRTVLDSNGADKLLGRGDMLFLRPGESKLIRAQGSLVTDKEIEKIVNFIKSQGEPLYDEEILKEQEKAILSTGQRDELYDEAVRIIMESNQASVSILQRRLRLGYTRAARIIDTMEQEGLIGSFEGSKPRRILVDRDSWLKNNLRQEAVKF